MTDINLDDIGKPEPKRDIESAMHDVLKDLNNEKKTSVMSELSDNEIKLLTKLKLLSKMRKNNLYDDAVSIFMKMRLSKDRQSRKEILTGIKNAHPEPQNQNLMFDKARQMLG